MKKLATSNQIQELVRIAKDKKYKDVIEFIQEKIGMVSSEFINFYH